MRTEKQITDDLWKLVSDLSNVNEYEFPYAIPKLQQAADRLLHEANDSEDQELKLEDV